MERLQGLLMACGQRLIEIDVRPVSLFSSVRAFKKLVCDSVEG